MDTPTFRQPLATIGNNSMDAGISTGASPVKRSVPRQARPSLPAASDDTHARIGLFAITEEHDAYDHIIACPKSAALLLGRARVTEGADEDDALMSTGTQDVVGGVPVHRIALPNTARHVSRDHCILYHTPFGASWAVKILGQNGLIVDGTRHRAGSILRLTSKETVLDFFGLGCLFVGEDGLSASEPKSLPRSSLPAAQQDGRSPRKLAGLPTNKPRVSLGTSNQESHVEERQEEDTTTVIEESARMSLIGNIRKRPLGAPLSPPTSSPAPFNASSSPSSYPAHRHLLASSPPLAFGTGDNDSEEDEDDDDYEEADESPRDRGASPTLQRRHAGSATPHHDDSSMLMQGANNSSKLTEDKRIDSEDEASQALAAAAVQRPKIVAPPRKTIKIIRRKIAPVTVVPRVTVPATDERKATAAAAAVAVGRKTAPAIEEHQAVFVDDEPPALSSPASTPRRPRDSKRVKFTVSAAQDEDTSTTAAPTATTTQRSATVQPTTMLAIQKHYRALVAVLAQSYDVQGLLAGAIVFHRTATISGTEAVRSVLSSNPGLMLGEVGSELKQSEGAASLERGSILDGWTRESIIESGLVKAEEAEKERVETWQRKAWREQLEVFLLEGECFGIIQRAGKDASGQPLECWYYYDKEHDPDTQRAANLGAFAKPMRAALKTHKPIFWRKSAYGTTSDDVKALQQQQGLADAMASSAAVPTESQYGSSGSTLNAALLTSAAAAMPASVPRTRPGGNVRSSAWEETQFEETEQTWDKEGDMDFDVSAAAGGAGHRRVKRSKK